MSISNRCSWRVLFGAGILFSLLVHASVLAAFLWFPSSRPPVLPDAIPIEIAMVSPLLAAPDEPGIVDLPDDIEQSEAISEQPTDPLETVPSQQESTDINALKVDTAADLQSEPKPESEPDLEPDPELESQPEPEAKPELEPAVVVESDSEHSAPKTTAPQAVEVETKAESATARRSGKLNEQIVQARDNWQHRLHAHLAQYKQYPSSARRKGREGSPRIAFTMSRDGTVLDVWLVQSSGTELLDRAAQQLIRQAEPLPALPDEVEEQQLTLTVPINYSL